MQLEWFGRRILSSFFLEEYFRKPSKDRFLKHVFSNHFLPLKFLCFPNKSARFIIGKIGRSYASSRATFNKLNFLFQRDSVLKKTNWKTISDKRKEIFGVVHYGTFGKWIIWKNSKNLASMNLASLTERTVNPHTLATRAKFMMLLALSSGLKVITWGIQQGGLEWSNGDCTSW